MLLSAKKYNTGQCRTRPSNILRLLPETHLSPNLHGFVFSYYFEAGKSFSGCGGVKEFVLIHGCSCEGLVHFRLLAALTNGQVRMYGEVDTQVA